MDTICQSNLINELPRDENDLLTFECPQSLIRSVHSLIDHWPKFDNFPVLALD